MIKRITAAFVALAIGVALSLVGATSAQAHTGDLNATAVCQTDGTYKVTYTLTISNTAESGTSTWSIGTTTFAHTPTSNANLPGTVQPGTVSSSGAGAYVLGTTTIPGSSTQAPWAYAYTIWTPDNYQKGSDGGDIALAGTCAAPDAAAAISTSTPTCQSASVATWTGLVNATGGTLDQSTGTHSGIATAKANHKFPAGTGVSANGQTKTMSYTIVAQLSGDNCLATATLSSTTSCTANSTESYAASHATLTSGALKTTPGSYSATFTAVSGYHFSGGASTLTLPYTISAPIGYQNTNANAACYQEVSVTPAFPTQTGPTCTVAGALPALPSGQTGITYTWAPDALTMVATANSGFTFPANTVANHTYTKPASATGYQNTDPKAPCYQPLPVTPAFPNPTVPTCTVAGSLPTLPTGTNVTYTWAPDGLTMMATANSGYFFPANTVATHTYTTPAGAIGYQNTNSEAPCYQAVSVTPSFPQPTGPTCAVAGSLPALPTGQEGVTYSWDVDGLTMVASANSGYFFPANTVATHTYTTPAGAIGYQNTNSDEPCYQEVSVTPSFPEPTGPTCTVAGSLPTLPTGTNVTYTWAPDGLTMMATANSGYFFPANTVATRAYTTPAGALGYQNTNPDGACYQLDSVAASASENDQSCSVTDEFTHLVDGFITVGIATGVNYQVTQDSDVTHAFITFDPTSGETGALAPGAYTVHPVALSGFVLTNPADIPLTIGAYTDACGQLITHPAVDPAAAQSQITCKAPGSYTLSSNQESPDAVVWTVNGSTVGAGPYSVTTAGHYVIDAAPGEGFGFTEGIKTHWVFDFTAATCDLKTLAMTGDAPGGLLVLAGFLTLFGLALMRRSAQRRKTARI